MVQKLRAGQRLPFSSRRMKYAICLPYPSKLAQGRIIGTIDPQSLQTVLSVFDDVPVALGVDTLTVSTDKAIHFSIVRLSPFGEQISFQITNADMGGGGFGHYLACQSARAGYPEQDRDEHVIVLVDNYRLRTPSHVPDIQIFTCGAENLHPGVLPVADEHPAVSVYPDGVRQIKLPRLLPGLPPRLD